MDSTHRLNRKGTSPATGVVIRYVLVGLGLVTVPCLFLVATCIGLWSFDKQGNVTRVENALRTHPRLPLWIKGAGRTSGPDDKVIAPTITVGRIPEDALLYPTRNSENLLHWPSLPFLIASDFLREDDFLYSFALGKAQPVGPVHGDMVTLFLVGPWMQSSQTWGPARLTRDGQVFTLLLEAWWDDGPWNKNIPGHPVYALNLGTLDAGDYLLQVEERDLSLQRQKTTHYAWRSVSPGKLPFTVSPAHAALPMPGERENLPKLDSTHFKEGAVPANAKNREWQLPESYSRALSWDARREEPPASGLRVGNLARFGWLDGNGMTITELPKLAPPARGLNLHAMILGPQLHTGETMTLREIVWTGSHAVIHVDVWRDDEQRRQKQVFSPVVVVPLESRWGLPAGDYTVEVEWTLLRAPTKSGPYTAEDTSVGEPGKLLEELKSRSRQTFTLE